MMASHLSRLIIVAIREALNKKAGIKDSKLLIAEADVAFRRRASDEVACGATCTAGV